MSVYMWYQSNTHRQYLDMVYALLYGFCMYVWILIPYWSVWYVFLRLFTPILFSVSNGMGVTYLDYRNYFVILLMEDSDVISKCIVMSIIVDSALALYIYIYIYIYIYTVVTLSSLQYSWFIVLMHTLHWPSLTYSLYTGRHSLQPWINKEMCCCRYMVYARVLVLMGSRLTYWERDKLADIIQATFSNAFPWLKMHEYQSRFHLSFFLRVQLIIFEHWCRICDKPLSEPNVTQFNDVFTRQPASMS